MELVTTQVLSSECYQSFWFEPVQFKGKEEYPFHIWFFYLLSQEPGVKLISLSLISSVKEENQKEYPLEYEIENDALKKSFSELYLLGITFSAIHLLSWKLDIQYQGNEYSFRGFADSLVVTVFYKEKTDKVPQEFMQRIDEKLQNL